MPEIENLVISVSSNAAAAASGFDRLASSMGKLGGASRSTAGGMKPVVSETKKVASTTEAGAASTKTWADRLKGLASSLAATGSASSKSASKLSTFVASLKRIAYYRFIRTVLKEITQGLKEGLTNLYTWSSAVNGNFAASMNTLSTAALYLKNSLAAMVSPLIESLAPAIDFIIDKFVGLLNVVNQFIAALGGASTYTAAKKVATTWSGAAKTAAGAARGAADDIKRTILGFDEINKLSKDSSGGGGGGGGGSKGGAGSTMFEERPINNTIKGIADTIRSVFGPIFDWIGENTEFVTAAVIGIGAALLAWKISDKLLPGLATAKSYIAGIGALLAATAIAVITVKLAYEFAKGYTATGSPSYLIADQLTSILGATIAGAVISKAYGAQAGKFAAGVVLEITAMSDLTVAFTEAARSGWTNKAAFILGLTGAVKAFAAGVLMFKGITGGVIGLAGALAVSLGISAVTIDKESDEFSVSAFGMAIGSALSAAGAGALFANKLGPLIAAKTGLTITAGGAAATLGGLALAIEFGIMAVSLAKREDIAYDEKASRIAIDSAMAAVGTGLAAFGIGISGVGAVAVGAAAGLMLYIYADDIAVHTEKLKFGDVVLTAQEIKDTVQKMFTVDVTAVANVVSTTIENWDTARSNLNQQTVVFQSSLNKIKLGVYVGAGQEELDALSAEVDDLIASFETEQAARKKVIELGVLLVPSGDSGVDMSKLLGDVNTSQSWVNQSAKWLADEYQKLFIDGLTEQEADAAYELGQWLYRVTTGAEFNAATIEYRARVAKLLDVEFSEDSYWGIVNEFNAQADVFTSAVADIAYESKAALEVERDQLQASIDAAKAYGQEVPQTVIGALEGINAAIKNWNPGEEVQAKTEQEFAPKVEALAQKMREGYQNLFNEMSTNAMAYFRTEPVYEKFLEGLSSGTVDDGLYASAAKAVAEGFQGALEDALGDYYPDAAEFMDKWDLTGWELIGGEAQLNFFRGLENAFDSETAARIFSELGYDTTEMFRSLGADLVDGMVVGIDGELSDEAKTLAELFGLPYDVAAEENEVHSPSKLFERLGGNLVAGLMNGLHTLGVQLQGVWDALPEGAKTAINTVLGLVSGAEVDIGNTIDAIVYNTKDELNTLPTWLDKTVINQMAGAFTGTKFYNAGKGATNEIRAGLLADPLPDLDVDVKVNKPDTAGIAAMFGALNPVITPTLKGPTKSPKTYDDVFGNKKPVVNPSLGEPTGKTKTFGELFGGLLQKVRAQLDKDNPDKDKTYGSLFGGLKQKVAAALGKDEPDKNKTFGTLFGGLLQTVKGKLEKDGPDKDKTYGSLFGGLLQTVKGKLEKDGPDKNKTFGTLFGGLEQTVNAGLQPKQGAPKQIIDLFGGSEQLTPEAKATMMRADDGNNPAVLLDLFGGTDQLTPKAKAELERAKGSPIGFAGEGNTLFGTLVKHVLANVEKNPNYTKNSLFGDNSLFGPLKRSIFAALKTDTQNSDEALKKLLATTQQNPFKLYAKLVNKDGKEEFTVNGKLKLSGKVGGNIELTKALGGILSNGRWSSIPQYAGGSLNAGSLFWAGEAGPELVGHANGRTEVLNRSQLASTMFAAVRAAMGTARINASCYDGGRDGAREEDMAMLMELVRQGSEATQRQNDILRQQNDYLRQINDKDFTAEISTSAIANGMARQNRRAGTTVVPVGT